MPNRTLDLLIWSMRRDDKPHRYGPKDVSLALVGIRGYFDNVLSTGHDTKEATHTVFIGANTVNILWIVL